MLRRRRRSGGGGAVNRPNITVPAAQAILLSSAPLVFATSIAVSDAVETSLTVSLAFPGGTITLDGTTGLSFSVGDGTADAAMTFSGTITNINNALSGMSVTAGSTGDRTLSITATNTTGSNSVSVAVQFGAIPVFTVDPAISGSTNYGNTLTCSDGTVTGYPTPTLTRQWQNAGSNISGQTASTWVSAFGDVGDTITCEVTATNAYGSVMAEATGVAITDPVLDCVITLLTDSSDNTPEWSVSASFQVGDVVTMELSTDSFGTIADTATATVTQINPVNTLSFDFGALANGTYQARAYITRAAVNGGYSNTTSFTIAASSAWTLSVPTASASGVGSVGATTDGNNGTLYAVLTTSSTTPSAAQVKAGQDHTSAAAPCAKSVSVSSSGAKTITELYGLAESTTYYAHLMHENTGLVASNVVTSSSIATAEQSAV
jgi:hypothetical protein